MLKLDQYLKEKNVRFSLKRNKLKTLALATELIPKTDCMDVIFLSQFKIR